MNWNWKLISLLAGAMLVTPPLILLGAGTMIGVVVW